MKIDSRTYAFIYLLALLIITLDTSAQIKNVYSTSTAISVLNPSSSPGGGATYVGNTSTGISATATPHSLGYIGPMNKKWNITQGITTQVAIDYAYLRPRMISEREEDPEPYDNGTQAFRDAVDFLCWAEFSPISAWAPVRCTVKFRFIPPVLGNSDQLKFDYSIDPSAAPERGTLTYWIR